MFDRTSFFEFGEAYLWKIIGYLDWWRRWGWAYCR